MLKETSRHFSCSVLLFCSHILPVPFGMGSTDFLLLKPKLIQVETVCSICKKKDGKHLYPATKKEDCSPMHV